MDRKILLKIKNVLALAEGTSNINEALTAANLAARMMRDHNLSPESLNEEPTVVDYAEKAGRPWLNIKSPTPNIQMLANIIAEKNECAVYLSKWDDGEEFDGMSIIGRPVDIVATETIFWFLHSQLLNLTSEKSPDDVNSFWIGAIAKLRERFAEQDGDFKRVNVNEEQIKYSIAKRDSHRTKIQDHLKSFCGDRPGTAMVDVKNYNLGYMSASAIEIEKRKQLN
jgi:hypothetical protein